MKKLILATSLLIAGLFGFGQEFNAGMYGGMVMSQLDGDTYSGYNKLGFTAGGYVNRFVTKKLGYQLGIRYINKGSKYVDQELGEYYKSVLRYVEMPVTVRYFIRKNIDLEGGLSLGYLVNSMEDTDGNGLQEPVPPFNKFELSALAGVNYHWSEKFSIGAFFNYSISPARPYSSGYSRFMDRGQYNNVIGLVFCYTLSSWK